MVSAGATIIALAIIGVVILIGWSVFSPILQGLVDGTTGLYTATQLLPKVGGGETICDLQIHVNAKVDQWLGVGETKFLINSDSVSTKWFDCYPYNNFPTAELIDLEARQSFNQYVFIPVDTTITGKVTVIDVKDTSQKVSSITQPQLSQKVTIPSTFSTSPFNLSFDYVVSNIPLRDYYVSIVFDKYRINDMEQSEPYVVTISGSQ